MAEKESISILGCGWLGLPLAEQLVSKGYRVQGSTTTPAKLEQLQQKQITPFLVQLQPDGTGSENLADFLSSDVLVLNIPPRMRAGEGALYLAKLRLLLSNLLSSPVSRVLFVSSTAVYPDLNRVVTEEDSKIMEQQEPDNVLLQAEKLFQEREEWMTSVVRFGGLLGGNRHPGRFLAGKTSVANGQAPVNLIHLDDCVDILSTIIERGLWGRTYNACSNEHPTRQEFYTKAALDLGLVPPTFAPPTETNFKIVSSQKLQTDLNWEFKSLCF